MVAALAADLFAVGMRVEMLQDYRWIRFLAEAAEQTAGPGRVAPGMGSTDVGVVNTAEEERIAFHELAAACDATIVIAPELSQALLERSRWVDAAGGRRLGPSLETVALASDKHATAEHLRRSGVPVPRGSLVKPGGPLPGRLDFPAVGKPCLGAGSHEVRLLAKRAEAESWAAKLCQTSRIESFHPGMAASVAVLCGTAGLFPLPPCRQCLSDDGKFRYLGGSLPLASGFARRAVALALRAVATLPGARGYLGVDLVLGADPTGRDDVVIEINPRLTTSYVGLRTAAAADANLAAALWDVCEGRVPRLLFRALDVQFDADGSCRFAAPGIAAVDRPMAGCA